MDPVAPQARWNQYRNNHITLAFTLETSFKREHFDWVLMLSPLSLASRKIARFFGNFRDCLERPVYWKTFGRPGGASFLSSTGVSNGGWEGKIRPSMTSMGECDKDTPASGTDLVRIVGDAV